MNKFTESIIFSFFVTLTLVVIDALFHLIIETAVHINYVAVKFTVIFLMVFLVTYWVGKSKTEGVFTSVVAPVIFYIYYVFANSTLNRELFKIDEDFWFIFIHITALLISYFVIYQIWVQKKGNYVAKNLAYAFIIALCVYGLDAVFQMSYVQFTTHNEEETAKTLNLGSSFLLVILLFILSFIILSFKLSFLLSSIIKNRYVDLGLFVVGSFIIIYLIGQNLIRSLVGIVSTVIPVYLSKIYLEQSEKK